MDIYESDVEPFRKKLLMFGILVALGVGAVNSHEQDVQTTKQQIEVDREEVPYSVVKLNDKYLIVDTANYEYLMLDDADTIMITDLEGNTIITDKNNLTQIGKYASLEEAQTVSGITVSSLEEKGSGISYN